jgi:hypothetical protein
LIIFKIKIELIQPVLFGHLQFQDR